MEYFEGYYELICVKDLIFIVDCVDEDELIIIEFYVIDDGWEVEDGEWFFFVVNEDFYDNIEVFDVDIC